jgi:hydrogenase expression/formation protein HypD
MRYIRGFRDGGAAAALAELIAEEVDPAREYHLMEFCGGHTHAIFRYGVQDWLPENVRLVHGPGCPVCVLAMPRLNAAIDLARRPQVTFVSYGDMIRVPASRRRSLLTVRAQGADVRMVYSALESLDIAAAHPERDIVFFAIGFETTTPATAHLILEAHRLGVKNLSVYCNHVLTPAAIQSILQAPLPPPPPRTPALTPAVEPRGLPRDSLRQQVRIDGFIGPSHVSAVIGSAPYEAFAHSHGKPVVIAGFEPLDVLQAVYMLVKQINGGRACVENQFTRGVTRDGNRKAQALVAEVLELRPSFTWRGLGELEHSAMGIRAKYGKYDAERRFDMPEQPVRENAACQCPSIIRGLKEPTDCTIFGSVCTPRSPIGSCMVSAEGVCAAYYKYRRVQSSSAIGAHSREMPA